MLDAFTPSGPAIVTFDRLVCMPDGKMYEAAFVPDYGLNHQQFMIADGMVRAIVPCAEDPVKIDVYSFEALESE